MNEKSAGIVGFIANLTPLYCPEQAEWEWCARSLQDGTLILPVDESGWDDSQGVVRLRWLGDVAREHEADGTSVASIALARYVEFHQFSQPEEQKQAMYESLAFHFEIKTGCVLHSPECLGESDLLSVVRRAAERIGESAVVNVLLKAAGLS